jgi:alkylated DNA repair dioxygenase AlkB
VGEPLLQLRGKDRPNPGKVYTYSGIKNDPKGWDYVSQNKKRVGGEIFQLKEMAEKLLNPAIQHKFNSVLLNLYQTGRSSVGWHSDNEPELGQNPVIASVSLGGERWFSLRHNITGQEVNILLEHGSCLLMGGELQKFWKHAILKDDRPMFSQPRINLTFRKII